MNSVVAGDVTIGFLFVVEHESWQEAVYGMLRDSDYWRVIRDPYKDVQALRIRVIILLSILANCMCLF